MKNECAAGKKLPINLWIMISGAYTQKTLLLSMFLEDFYLDRLFGLLIEQVVVK